MRVCELIKERKLPDLLTLNGDKTVTTGAHYLSREDWAVYMNFIKKYI